MAKLWLTYSLIRIKGIGDRYKNFALYKRDDNEFKLAYFSADFVEKSKENLILYMLSKLFELSYQAGWRGNNWENAPPNFYNNSVE